MENKDTSIWDMLDENYKEPFLIKIKRFFFIIPRFFKNIVFDIRIITEKLCNKGIAQRDLWNLDYTLCQWLYPRFKAFIKMKRMGYPSYFSEYEPNTYGDESKYKKLIEEGKIDPEVGMNLIRGPEKWEKVLKEIEFALDWKINCDFGKEREKTKFYLRWGYKNPHSKTELNKDISYIYNMTDKYLKESEDKDPIVKKFGGLAKEMSSDEPDLHIKEPENYIFIKERIFYYDCKYDMEIEKRAEAGFVALGKYLLSLWD